MSNRQLHSETLALHGGSFRSDAVTRAIEIPIYQTTAYQFNSTQQAQDLFALKELGNIYTRLTNPTVSYLAERITAIEGGALGVGVSSGQSATTLAILNVASAGDNIVSSTDLYGGTWNLFKNTFKQFGIEVRFVDPSNPENFIDATDEKTRAYYAESLPNPKLVVFPIEEIAKIGRSRGIPLIVDNTAAPLIIKPIAHGAAIVVYSATKFLEGHGTSLGGFIIDSGTFDWSAYKQKQILLNTPDPNYHGIVWAEDIKPIGPVAYALRIIAVLLRDLGTSLAPENAFRIIQGIKTLSLRMERQSDNAKKIAEFLQEHPRVTRVIYPSLHTGANKEKNEKYFEGNFYGALLGFELDGGIETGRKFIDSLELFYHVANIGDSRSLAIHPASTTHSQLTPEEQLHTGVTGSYVRLSVGIENIADLLADIEQALNKV